MTCAPFEERIGRYVGGDSGGDEAAAVEQHLRGCAHCAEFARALQEDREWLASRPPETAGVDFAAMRYEIRRQVARPRWGWRWIAAAAMILLAVGAALTVRRPVRLLEARKEAAAGGMEPAAVWQEAVVSRKVPKSAPARRSKQAADLRAAPHAPAEPPVEIRVATRDPNVTIILLHETREVSQ
ncbi:MAG TPA: zf-HC2 domain-containing protein [Bryobacteraceae bacterium]|jgi:anti-sigma factor RsiW|nr:zf-HC2 domain-containing protein [Bryobacteraceae bacterium]